MPDNPPHTNLDTKFVDKLGLHAMDDLPWHVTKQNPHHPPPCLFYPCQVICSNICASWRYAFWEGKSCALCTGFAYSMLKSPREV